MISFFKRKTEKFPTKEDIKKYIKNQLKIEVLESKISKEDAKAIESYFMSVINNSGNMNLLAFNLAGLLLDLVTTETSNKNYIKKIRK